MEEFSRQSRVVLPCMLNNHGTLFGGNMLQWMDEVAYITATRKIAKKMITVSVDRVVFMHPVYLGNIVEVVGRVGFVKNAKMEVIVEVLTDVLGSNEKIMAATASFKLAAVDENNRPVRLTD